MIKIAFLSLPVAILPLLAVQALESLMTHSGLPEVASALQNAVVEPAGQRSQSAVGTAAAEGDEALAVRLALTLQF
ncbi:MAG: hypothetical protein RIR62_1780 [Pseudomonadota bacterium]|jgi:hypothetical protein